MRIYQINQTQKNRWYWACPSTRLLLCNYINADTTLDAARLQPSVEGDRTNSNPKR